MTKTTEKFNKNDRVWATSASILGTDNYMGTVVKVEWAKDFDKPEWLYQVRLDVDGPKSYPIWFTENELTAPF